MVHNASCANAQGSECKCSCGGTLHGTGIVYPPPTPAPPITRRHLCIPMGKMVARIIKRYRGIKYTCTCGYTIEIREFVGYSDASGYPDRTNKTWRICVKCPGCGHEWPIQNIPIRRPIRPILESYIKELEERQLPQLRMPRFELQEKEDYFLLIDRDCPTSREIRSNEPVCGEIAKALECCIAWATGHKYRVNEIECRAMEHDADIFRIEKAVTG